MTFFKLASRNNNENFSFLSQKKVEMLLNYQKENMVKLTAETYCLLFFVSCFQTQLLKKSSELDQDIVVLTYIKQTAGHSSQLHLDYRTNSLWSWGGHCLTIVCRRQETGWSLINWTQQNIHFSILDFSQLNIMHFLRENWHVKDNI